MHFYVLGVSHTCRAHAGGAISAEDDISFLSDVLHVAPSTRSLPGDPASNGAIIEEAQSSDRNAQIPMESRLYA